jgi:hypothetical protein
MESKVLLENGESIKIPRKVVQSKQLENLVIILTDYNENNKVNNENVYCYDVDGNELWQIEDLNLFHEEHYYTSIYFQDSELYIYNFCGVEVKIVAETGKVLSKELIK